MKRTSDTATVPPSLHALILHHHALLNDPEVLAFLDHPLDATHTFDSLSDKLMRANEPALLLELLKTAQCSHLTLCATAETGDYISELPEGLFEYVAQHIVEAPGVTSLTVAAAVLTATSLARLQATLNAPGCKLTSLTFASCTFADPHVQFPLSAPTIEEFDWNEDSDPPGPEHTMAQCLPALAGWHQLSTVYLMSPGAALNFTLITQLLQANPGIKRLYLVSGVAPVGPGGPAHVAQQDPSTLFEALAGDHTSLTQLAFHVLDASNENFNDFCLQGLARCMLTNTTLEVLDIPGIRMSSAGIKRQFIEHLQHNRSLIALAPLDIFGDQTPPSVRRNQHQRFWFTQEFILGAAQAFLQMLGAHKDVGTLMASHLAPTPIERTYCGSLMALLCKSTHDGAVKLRSSGMREAIKLYIKTNDEQRCLDLVAGLVEFRLDLLPADKQAVAAFARAHGRLNCLPAGYAG